MNIAINTRVTAIVFAVLIASVVLISFNPVNAQNTLQNGAGIPLPAGVTPDVSLDSIAYLSYRPNPIGVGQPVLINIWMQPPLHASRYFSGLSVTFTKPDGTKDTIGPIDTYRGDATAWFEYVVDQAGNWSIKFDFPGNYYPVGIYQEFRSGSYEAGDLRPPNNVTFTQSVYYKPATSGEQPLMVQEQQVGSWPTSPLPTDYWTRPISPENRDWWVIAGYFPSDGVVGKEPNWPAKTNIYSNPDYAFTPYVQGPTTSHVLWRRMGEKGGLIGGSNFGQKSFYTGGGFGRTSNFPNLIFVGRCYDTVTKVVNGQTMDVWQCYDLRTGEIYWERTGVPAATFVTYERTYVEVPGAVSEWRQTERLGVITGTNLIKYDPWTGAVTENVTIPSMSSHAFYKDPFVLSVQSLGSSANRQYRLINWSISGATNNFTLRVQNNITWPFSSLGTSYDLESLVAVNTEGINSVATQVAIDVRLIAASMKTGTILWNITADVGFGFFSGSTGVADHGKFALRFNDGLWRCWDLNSGKKLWTSELSDYPWGAFGAYAVASAYGYFYSMAYDSVQAIDWDTGKFAWKFQALTPYPYETPYEGVYPWFSQVLVADGKFYIYNNEHTINQPYPRGLKMFCLNATSGEHLWNITGYMQPGAIADGYLTAGNMYDGYMYVFGKGPSKTTVEAPLTAVPKGQGILIQGTVTDQSPGQIGAACVSEASMTTYMEYLHMQKPIPNDVTVMGVPVTLRAIDSNNNVIEIGTATSDLSGKFQYAWTPTTEGLFKITATFTGDNSYGSSWTETGLSVGPAPTTTSQQQETVIPNYTTLILGGIIATIIAVAIVGALLFITLRKR